MTVGGMSDTIHIDQEVLVAAVRVLSTDFDAEDGVDVSAVSRGFLVALVAELTDAIDGDESEAAMEVDAIRMAMAGKKGCPVCFGNQVIWNPTDEDEHRETTCPRCGGRGVIGRGE